MWDDHICARRKGCSFLRALIGKGSTVGVGGGGGGVGTDDYTQPGRDMRGGRGEDQKGCAKRWGWW